MLETPSIAVTILIVYSQVTRRINSMPYCSGCSKHYRFLEEGERCDPCLETPSVAKSRDEWPNCVDCGRRYEFLKEAQCGKCKDRDDTNAMPPPGVPRDSSTDSQAITQEIQHAMANPINPRTHGTTQGTYSNPFQQSPSVQDLNDPRYHNAQAVFKEFQNGFTNALERSAPQMKVANPKFRGAESGSNTKPVRKIHVVIRKIINRNQKNLTTDFDSQLTSYEATRLWSSIEDNVTAWLDGVYSKEHQHRIRSKNDFTLQYSHRKVSLLSVAREEGATLQDLWKQSVDHPGLLIQAKHAATFTLELDAIVQYPPKKLNRKDSEYNTSSKRNAEDYPTDSLIQSSKKYITGQSGAHTYATNIVSMATIKPTANQEGFTVKKFTVSFIGTPPDTTAVWDETEEKFLIIIDKTKFSSGKTKNAFKLRFTKTPALFYAAKSYYDIGSYSVPTHEENMQNLKKELIRQLTIKDAVSVFLNAAEECNIAVHDLQVADAFLVQVCEGDDIGRCWSADRLLDYRKMRKYSGTDKAGANTDFAGMTCDAFAHFTLVTSELEFVPVDIQGIDTQVFRETLPVANTITLLDIMAHSKNGTMGLGDNGLDGMKLFCKQHKCNRICKRFKLTSTSDLIESLENMEMEEREYDDDDIIQYVDEVDVSANTNTVTNHEANRDVNEGDGDDTDDADKGEGDGSGGSEVAKDADDSDESYHE